MSFTSVDGVPVFWATFDSGGGINCDTCKDGKAMRMITVSYSPWATGDPDDDLQSASCICEACGGRLRAEMELLKMIRKEIGMREKRAAKKRREKALYGPPRNQKPILLFDPEAFHQPALFSPEWLRES